eukprot:m.125591 g.125591  ORF g.125591 m.125591 type:complete len:127 (-) comp23472_c0_seq2:738-1118(-)
MFDQTSATLLFILQPRLDMINAVNSLLMQVYQSTFKTKRQNLPCIALLEHAPHPPFWCFVKEAQMFNCEQPRYSKRETVRENRKAKGMTSNDNKCFVYSSSLKTVKMSTAFLHFMLLYLQEPPRNF